MVWLGMRRLGYLDEAERLADGVIAAAAREGLREYYDPRTGKGLGAKDFAWSALVAELANPDDSGLTSYL
jgi:GH15 family glucan-1,4-alpha-glucosidase